MFRLIRWLLLMGVIAFLLGFLLTFRLQGRTSAERVCALAGSRPCEQLAERWGLTAERWIARWREMRGERPAPARAPVHRTGVVVDATRGKEAPPLDRHTPGERAAVDRILAERASR